MRFTDRSRTTTDWGCKRRRYWTYEAGGRGFVPSTEAIALFLGSAIHGGLAQIALSEQIRAAGGPTPDISLIASTAAQDVRDTLLAENPEGTIFANEQAALIEGLLRAFYKHSWPRLLAQWPKVVVVEEEVTLPIGDDLTFMSKPDLLLAKDDLSEIVYMEHKSTSSKKPEWITSWNSAVQVHSTMKAVEHTLGLKVDSVVISGLYKGYVSYGKQSSPLIYGYARSANPPFTRGEVRYDYAPGFKKVPVWELEGGVEAWVEGMSPETLMEQLPTTPPIFIREDLVAQFFAHLAHREEEIAEAMLALSNGGDQDTILNHYFPQNFSACSPGWGSPCPYRSLCFGHVSDPLTAGYQVRVSHHAPEAKAWMMKEIE